MKKLFIFGLGEAGCAVAHTAKAAGWQVTGTRRDPAVCEALRTQGIAAMLFDDVTDYLLAQQDAILISTPTVDSVGDPVLARYGEMLKRLKHYPWLGYFSTTGVYGDCQGQWVNETTSVRPDNARLERRVQAEEQYRGLGAQLFRLAGIYGPGRNALTQVLTGTARRIDKPGQVFSRIHVEDIAGVVLASLTQPHPGEIYNVCDDEPAPAHEVVAYACELLRVTPPPLVGWEEAGLSAMGREFYSANRRVSNQKVKKALGYALRYPSYREGLQALAKALEAEPAKA